MAEEIRFTIRSKNPRRLALTGGSLPVGVGTHHAPDRRHIQLAKAVIDVAAVEIDAEHRRCRRATRRLAWAMDGARTSPDWSVDKISVSANGPNRSVSLLERAMQPAPAGRRWP